MLHQDVPQTQAALQTPDALQREALPPAHHPQAVHPDTSASDASVGECRQDPPGLHRAQHRPDPYQTRVVDRQIAAVHPVHPQFQVPQVVEK